MAATVENTRYPAELEKVKPYVELILASCFGKSQITFEYGITIC